MKRKNMLIGAGIALSLAVLASGVAISAGHDKYTVKVPDGLAFSEFRGYESWPVIAVSHNGDMLRCDSRQSHDGRRLQVRHSRQRQAFPGWREDGEGPLEREEERSIPGPAYGARNAA